MKTHVFYLKCLVSRDDRYDRYRRPAEPIVGLLKTFKLGIDSYPALCYSTLMKKEKSIHDKRELAKTTPEPNENVVICKYCNIELEPDEIRVFGDCCEMCNEFLTD